MGKRPRTPQNGKVAGEHENGSRRRPEDIVADAFLEPVPASATDGWSMRSRRTILVAMAVVGAVTVGTGLLLSGGLGPGPGHPRPVQANTDASVLGRSLLRPLAEQQNVTTTTGGANPLPTAPTTPGRASTAAPVLPLTTAGPGAPTSEAGSTTTPTQPTPTTTRPCTLVGKSIGTAVKLPPLCPPG
jgi:hypothetical protein